MRLAPVLGMILLIAACGSPSFDVRPLESKGATWFPQVVAFEQNAGLGLSITSDADGNPHLAYLQLPEAPPPGATPGPVDPLAPVLPAIGHSHLVNDIWTHTEVAEDRQKLSLIAGSGSTTPSLGTSNETAIAVDAKGTHHIAWTEKGEILYSNDPTGETEPAEVDSVDAAGLSIAADEQGAPWIAYYEVLEGAEGPSTLVRVATLEGDRWEVSTAAEADASEPFGTGIGVGPDGPMVAYGGATGTMLARQQGSTWRSEVADKDGGLGVSMDLDADGNPHLAYLTPDGQVRHAHSIEGGNWEVSDVGAAAGLATTSIALDADGVHHIAWQRDVDIAYATNADGDFAEVPLPRATLGGSRPRLATGPEGIVNLAWYSAQGTSLNMATYTEDEPLLAVPSPSSAPGGDGGVPAECSPEGTELTITAPAGAASSGFDKDCLAVNAGEAFTVELVNDDTVPHNFSIYPDETSTEKILDGGSGAQPGTTTTEDGSPIDEPGNLFFKCDFHPTTMTGTFVVAGK
jgi:plastocyanin